MATNCPPTISSPSTGVANPPPVVTYKTSRSAAVLPNCALEEPESRVEVVDMNWGWVGKEWVD
ncbi:hypothetical protein ABVK25_006444 [Lepraria finkii]|uniref:Uncharacterized protein n=1 Tax=Lepraria finkii TaxID=1340010 RepID=A0ABR4B6G0_9LECA